MNISNFTPPEPARFIDVQEEFARSIASDLKLGSQPVTRDEVVAEHERIAKEMRED